MGVWLVQYEGDAFEFDGVALLAKLGAFPCNCHGHSPGSTLTALLHPIPTEG